MQSELVVITGAAQGIGRALTQKWIERNSRVVALDISQENLNQLKEDFGDFVYPFATDVTNYETFRETAKKIKADLGQPSVWVNNAGISQLGPFELSDPNQFERVIDVNLRGVTTGTRLALELMTDPVRGTIINIGSMAGLIPAPFMAAYSASKHAVVGFTRALQQELKDRQVPIRLVLVCPGFVDTKILESGAIRLPNWFRPALGTTEQTAREIISGVNSGLEFIVPTLHGKALHAFSRLAPRWARGSSRMLLAKNWKELLGLDPLHPGGE